MLHKNILLTTIIAFLLFSCTPSQLSEEELNAYILDEGNGLTQSIQRNGIDFSVNYRPTDLLVAQELNGKQDKVLIDSLRRKYGKYAYFILNISKDDKEILKQMGSFGAFSEALQTISFRMGEYVDLTTSKQDTIPVADSVYPRLYGMGQATSILFVFNAEKILESDWLSFNLKDLGLNTGKTKFRFETQQIREAPKIYD